MHRQPIPNMLSLRIYAGRLQQLLSFKTPFSYRRTLIMSEFSSRSTHPMQRLVTFPSFLPAFHIRALVEIFLYSLLCCISLYTIVSQCPYPFFCLTNLQPSHPFRLAGTDTRAPMHLHWIIHEYINIFESLFIIVFNSTVLRRILKRWFLSFTITEGHLSLFCPPVLYLPGSYEILRFGRSWIASRSDPLKHFIRTFFCYLPFYVATLITTYMATAGMLKAISAAFVPDPVWLHNLFKLLTGREPPRPDKFQERKLPRLGLRYFYQIITAGNSRVTAGLFRINSPIYWFKHAFYSSKFRYVFCPCHFFYSMGPSSQVPARKVQNYFDSIWWSGARLTDREQIVFKTARKTSSFLFSCSKERFLRKKFINLQGTFKHQVSTGPF